MPSWHLGRVRSSSGVNENYSKSLLHSFSCRVLLAVYVHDAAALRLQLWGFRCAVAFLDQANAYSRDMLRCAGSWPLWSIT
jgi:hypothetical protein